MKKILSLLLCLAMLLTLGLTAMGQAEDGGAIWNADMSSGLVGLGYGDDTMTQQVSDELKAEVEALAEKIIAGEIEVESTR